MQPWDYLVFVPVLGAGWYLFWQRRQKKSSCGACSSCPTQSCGSREERKAQRS